LRLNLFIRNLCNLCLITASPPLTFDTTRQRSVSQSHALNYWTSRAFECLHLSIRTW
jgi:hypothetical protein